MARRGSARAGSRRRSARPHRSLCRSRRRGGPDGPGPVARPAREGVLASRRRRRGGPSGARGRRTRRGNRLPRPPRHGAARPLRGAGGSRSSGRRCGCGAGGPHPVQAEGQPCRGGKGPRRDPPSLARPHVASRPQRLPPLFYLLQQHWWRASRSRMLRVFDDRDFALYWLSSTVSLLGDGIYFVAIAWEVYHLSNRPSALASVGAAWTLPQPASLLFAGAISDRLDRRRVMMVASATSGLAIGGIAALTLLGVVTLWQLWIL